MKILWGQELVDDLRKRADGLRNRLWIASPYGGSWQAVQCVLGISWYARAGISVRLLTDWSDDSQYLNPDSVRRFAEKGEIKHIPGLHAKVYIVDDSALVTSANQTETAFSKRLEAGIFLSGGEEKEIIDLYQHWWKDEAGDLPAEWVPKSERRSTGTVGEPSGKGLRPRWGLPPPPEIVQRERSTPVAEGEKTPTPATVRLTPAETRKLEGLLPRKNYPGRRKVLDALLAGSKTWVELDALVPRGRTPKTASRYAPGGYPVCATNRLNDQLKGQLPIRIKNRATDVFRLMRLKGQAPFGGCWPNIECCRQARRFPNVSLSWR